MKKKKLGHPITFEAKIKINVPDAQFKQKGCNRVDDNNGALTDSKKSASSSREAKSVTISGSKERVRVGSHVRIRGRPEPSVGKVVKIERSSPRGQANIYLRWFYRPEDTRAGRQPFHGHMEMLFSDRVEQVRCPTSALELCRLWPLEEYMAKRVASSDKSTYYWRFHYETESGICNRVPEFCSKCRKTFVFLSLGKINGQVGFL